MIDSEQGSEQWSRLRFGTRMSPGVCKVTTPGIVIGWDIQNASGQAGATTKRTHEPLKECTVEFDLSNEVDEFNVSDFDRWDEFEAFLLSLAPASKKPIAVAVYHPELARVGITSVTLKSIGGMVLDGRGGGKVTVALMEFRPPKPMRLGTTAATKTEGDRLIDQANADLKKEKEIWKDVGGEGVTHVIGDTI